MDEISKSKRNLILINACTATFMANLDGSIVNIVLPTISHRFDVSIDTVQWVVTAYLLTISSLLLVWGKLADLHGRRFLFGAGLGIFTLGSLLCGLSNSFTMLVISRIVQALGGSITVAMTHGIVTSVFPSNERGKALGAVATSVALGGLAGPSLGGVLVHMAGWESIFFINIPLGILGVILTIFILPEVSNLPENKSFDFIGTLIFVPAVTLLFIGLLNYQDNINAPAGVIVAICLAIIMLVGFLLYERRRENPLINIKLFKNKVFSIGLAAAFLSYASMYTYIFLMPFYLQYVVKMDVLQAGLLMSLYPVMTGIVAPISGWLSDKITYKPLTIIGLLVNVITYAIISTLNAASETIQIAMLIMLLGIGSGMFQAPNNSSIMGAVPRDKLGSAGSINAFFRNFGMVSGTAISVIIFTLVTRVGISSITTRTFNSAIFLKGFSIVQLNAAALSFIAVLISFIRIRRVRRAKTATKIESIMREFE